MKNLITNEGLIQIEYPLGIFCGSCIASIFGVPMASTLALSFLVVTGLVAVHNVLMHICARSLGDVASSVYTDGFEKTVQECQPNFSDPLVCQASTTLVPTAISMKESIDKKQPLNVSDCRSVLFQTMRLSTVDGTLFGKGKTPGMISRSMAFCNRLSESVNTIIFGNNSQVAEPL